MSANTYYYARISKQLPELGIQLNNLRQIGAVDSKLYIDEGNRKNYAMLREKLCYGDILVMQSLFCLGGHATIRKELEFLVLGKIRLKIIDLPATMSDVECYSTLLISQLLSMLDKQNKQTQTVETAEITANAEPEPEQEQEIIPKLPEKVRKICLQYLCRSISTQQAVRALKVDEKTFRAYVRVVKKDKMNWSVPQD